MASVLLDALGNVITRKGVVALDGCQDECCDDSPTPAPCDIAYPACPPHVVVEAEGTRYSKFDDSEKCSFSLRAAFSILTAPPGAPCLGRYVFIPDGDVNYSRNQLFTHYPATDTDFAMDDGGCCGADPLTQAGCGSGTAVAHPGYGAPDEEPYLPPLMVEAGVSLQCLNGLWVISAGAGTHVGDAIIGLTMFRTATASCGLIGQETFDFIIGFGDRIQGQLRVTT